MKAHILFLKLTHFPVFPQKQEDLFKTLVLCSLGNHLDLYSFPPGLYPMFDYKYFIN